jgi:hypothetical protein
MKVLVMGRVGSVSEWGRGVWTSEVVFEIPCSGGVHASIDVKDRLEQGSEILVELDLGYANRSPSPRAISKLARIAQLPWKP